MKHIFIEKQKLVLFSNFKENQSEVAASALFIF